MAAVTCFSVLTFDLLAPAALAGEITAAHAVRSACVDLKQVCSHIDGVFDAAVTDFKARHPQEAEEGSK